MAKPPDRVGRYEILSPIGQGGMGAVYRARDPTLGRIVAIKVLHEITSEEFRRRFALEARAAASLSHVNIITVFDFGEDEGRPFIVMEYVAGETLAQIVHRQAALPLVRKLQIIEDVCAGLAHAHAAGVVHRDVKPANVMITADGTVKILDFGIARLTDASSTLEGVMIGTPNYMAPEQLEGRGVDHRADIFTVGALLYELVTYRRAFPGPEISESMFQILRSSPQPIAAFLPEAQGVDAIVTRALAKDREERYSSANDLQKDLRALRAVFAARVDPPTVRSQASTTVIGPLPTDLGASLDEDRSVMLVAPPRTEREASGVPEVQLIVTSSSNARLAGRVFKIDRPLVQIGRDPTLDVNLPDPRCSRRHAEIAFENDGFTIRDLGSNGTFVNGRRVPPGGTLLYFGSGIQIGDTTFTFSAVGAVSLPDLTGHVVDGRYSLEKLIREGARGAVYAARHTRLPQHVALKLLSPDLIRYAGYREQFKREAETAASLNHPHICPLVDFGETELRVGGRTIRTMYLCLKLMDGGTLTDRLAGPPVDLDRSVAWIEKLASALDHAHRRGVVHGNLKPSTVVFDADEHPYLTDFSIAQSTMNPDGRLVSGTPAYMAPEQWDDQMPAPPADQFSLAALAYFLVTGSRPFEGQESPDVRARNFRRGAAPAHEEAHQNGREGVPRAASEVLNRALSVSPQARFGSPVEFADALAAAFRRRSHAKGHTKVFLSYHRDLSAGWAVLFARELKTTHGVGVFVDTERRDSAGRFPVRLAQAIEDCDVFVCLLAAATLDSRWVKEEIKLAYHHNRPMVPVFQESFTHPDPEQPLDPSIEALLSYDGVHLLDRRNIHVDHTIADLARLLKSGESRDA